jgi:hypothetical protein
VTRKKNSKSQAPNPKQAPNANDQMTKTKTMKYDMPWVGNANLRSLQNIKSNIFICAIGIWNLEINFWNLFLH